MYTIIDTIIFYVGYTTLGIFVWKSNLALKWKKILIALVILVIFSNLFSLITGEKILPFLFGK